MEVKYSKFSYKAKYLSEIGHFIKNKYQKILFTLTFSNQNKCICGKHFITMKHKESNFS